MREWTMDKSVVCGGDGTESRYWGRGERRS